MEEQANIHSEYGDKISLGDSVEDTITGIQGTVSAICKYIGGYTQAKVEWSKGNVAHEMWVEIKRLEKF